MKKAILGICAFIIYATAISQVTISGVTLPAKLEFNNKTLKLNGGGLREKLWIDLYVGGLYLPEKMNDAKRIIAANQMQAIRLVIVSSLISSEKMEEAVEEGFENSTNGNTKPLRDKIDKFKSFFSKEPIKKNDIFDIVYIPGKGTIVYKNNKIVGIVEGFEFKKALLAIWLGDKPADDDLKEGLLGIDN
jgi:hypothetical protein